MQDKSWTISHAYTGMRGHAGRRARCFGGTAANAAGMDKIPAYGRPLGMGVRSRAAFQHLGHVRAVDGIGGNVMKPHDPVRIDQDVAAQLPDVVGGQLEFASCQQKPDVSPPGLRPHDGPPPGSAHSIVAVELAILVADHGPGNLPMMCITAREVERLKRHHKNVDVVFTEPSLKRTQLRHVFATRQSGEMAVEHKEQPAASKHLQPITLAIHARQVEGASGLPFEGIELSFRTVDAGPHDARSP